MTLRQFNASTGTFEPGSARARAPAFRYDATAGRWLDAYLDDGLVGYWSFEDVHISGSTAEDASGTGNDGTMSGGITTGVKAPVGQGFTFDGVDDTVTVSDPSIPSGATGETLTMSLWINPGQNVTRQNITNMMDEWDVTHENGTVYLRTYGGNNTAGPGISAPVGEWTHAVIVWVAGTEIRSYENASHTDTTAVSDTSSSTTSSLDIGDSGYKGDITDIRIYNRALSTAEIQALYTQGLPRAVAAENLAGWWTANDGDTNGTTLADRSLYTNDATLVNGVTTGASSPIGEAYSLDAVDDYVEIPAYPATGLNDGEFTVMLWYRPHEQPGGVGWTDILQLSQSPGLFRLEENGSTAGRLGWYSQDTAGNPVHLGGVDVPTDEWSHTAIVVETGSSGTSYLNASVAESTSWTETLSDFTGTTSELLWNQTDIPYDATDIRIYDRALSSAEIYTIYNEATL